MLAYFLNDEKYPLPRKNENDYENEEEGFFPPAFLLRLGYGTGTDCAPSFRVRETLLLSEIHCYCPFLNETFNFCKCDQHDKKVIVTDFFQNWASPAFRKVETFLVRGIICHMKAPPRSQNRETFVALQHC